MDHQIDFAILHWIQDNLRCDFLDFLMPKLTLYAEYGILFILTGAVLLLFHSTRKCGATVLTGLSLGLLTGNIIIKNVIARERPCWLNPELPLLVAVPGDYSFPSCHTLHSFIFATVLLYYDKRFGIPALVMAFLTGFSRMYLYVHFPTDVLGGAVLGVAIGLLAVFCVNKVTAFFIKRKETRHAGSLDR